MAEIKKLSQITSLPGIRRDGTQLDADYFTDGQWVRFQRGRPKKMGGYTEISANFVGPVRQVLVWSRGYLNTVYSFSPNKIEMASVDIDGNGGQIYDRTPSGFVGATNHVWSVDTMYDDAVGSTGTIVVAHPNKALANIDDDTATQVYFGLASNNAAFTAIAGLTVSGGIMSLAPYLVYYGSDGLVGWSEVNEPQTLTGGDAGTDRVTGAKIVKGLPLRSGGGPAGLLWSLDSLILMQWVGGDAIFRFTTVSAQSSILSQNGVIEYDGAYFWIGVDRFMSYSGGQVMEVPNQMNLNWFFDHLDYANRQKVWATKMPRFGEIWWFYPRDDATECTHAVILNVREKTWYDCALPRSAGFYSQVFHYPVLMDSVETPYDYLYLFLVSGSFNVGNTISGGTSTSSALIMAIKSSGIYKVQLTSGTSFTVGETITNLTVAGSGVVGFKTAAYTVAAGTLPALGEVGTGATSTKTCTVAAIDATEWAAAAGTLKVSYTSGAFTPGETVNFTGGGSMKITANFATGTATSEFSLYSGYVHDKGKDAVVGETQDAIESYFTTSDFGYPTGGAQQNNIEGLNRWTRLVRVEPDFVMTGDMTLEVIGREFAQAPDVTQPPLTFDSNSDKIDMRVQARQIRVKFTSNTLGGDYEMGRVILHTEPGDVRS